MATLTTSYQKIGTGGVKTFGATKARIDLYAKYNSQSTANNTTNWSIEARLVITSGSYIGDYTGTTLTLSGDGISSSQSKGTGNFKSQTLGSASGTVTHNNDGTKSISASASMQFKAWGQTLTVSGSATLPTIPRYANLTSLNVVSRTETSITLSFTTDKTARIFAKINDGQWLNNGAPFVDNTTGGTFTIRYKDRANTQPLDPNTTYKITVLCRNTTSGLDTSKDINGTTYDYPYCTSSPNFAIGNNLTLNFYNPLSRSIKVYIIGADGTQYGGDTITGTSLSGYSGTGWVDWWYSTIPNAKSGRYQVKVVYGNITKTRNNGNTYTVKENECLPIFNDFEYEDVNTDTLNMTCNNQLLVNNNSDCLFVISSENKAEAKKYASISKYVINWGSVTNEITDLSSENLEGHCIYGNGNILKITAVDSRGISTTITKTITIVPYQNAFINELSTQRKDGVDSKTFLAGKFTIYNGSWDGTATENSQNRLKYVGIVFIQMVLGVIIMI